MTTTPGASSTSIWRMRAPGLLFAAAIGLGAMGLARLPALQSVGLSALPLAIILGIVIGNTLFPRIAAPLGAGVDYAKAIGQGLSGVIAEAEAALRSLDFADAGQLKKRHFLEAVIIANKAVIAFANRFADLAVTGLELVVAADAEAAAGN